MKVKKVFKYGTGHVIPKGAVYLNTIVGTWMIQKGTTEEIREAKLVWHYFLVEVEVGEGMDCTC